jgi:hypothetical protein
VNECILFEHYDLFFVCLLVVGRVGVVGAVAWMVMLGVLVVVCFLLWAYLFVIVGDCFSYISQCGKHGKLLETVCSMT